MYIPDIYKNEDPIEIRNFLSENGFGILVNQTDGKLCATHIPMQFEVNSGGQEVLHGHLSKANIQATGFTDNNQVLAIFTGPHSYISSSWYDHENVPTWNYIAVHVYGNIRILNKVETLQSLNKLVTKYEQTSENPVKFEELSEKTLREANGVVGFEIIISEIQATKKLSQNRDKNNYENIINALQKTENAQAIAVAKEMTKCPK